MELVGPWEAVVADEERRRTWLDDGDDAGGAGWQPIVVPGHEDSTFGNIFASYVARASTERPEPALTRSVASKGSVLVALGELWSAAGSSKR